MKEKIEIGCSSMVLTSKEGNKYWFRTCDLDEEKNVWKIGSKVISFPKNHVIKFSNGIEYESKNSILGVTYGNKYTKLLDGINDKGLTGGLLFLLEGKSVKLEEIKKDNIGVEGMELITWILSQCSNIQDVLECIKNIQLTNVLYEEQSIPATMHYTFIDNNENAIVLETNSMGEFIVYTNTIGVMTNSPTYPEHIMNLKWYINNSIELKYGRSDKNLPGIKNICIDGVDIEGENNRDSYLKSDVFPGSYVSYDRFIRLSILKFLNDNGKNFNDSNMLLEGSKILSSVVVPKTKGYFYYNYLLKDVDIIKHSKDGKILYGGGDDYTQYEIMYDINKKEMYIKPEFSLNWSKKSISEIDDKLQIHEI